MSDLRFPKKRKNGKKLSVTKVQELFNAAIRRRDWHCVMYHSPHAGQLEASHFFTVGGNAALRFHPDNCHTQCTKHHFSEFHLDNPLPYTRWMEKYIKNLEWMETHRKKTVKYNQANLEVIAELCINNKLRELKRFIESLIGE